MSDNKQPDALDRLRRRPSPSATPAPVAKDAPLLNDEARKLLEDKSKAAALATKRAAEAGARKSMDAGKAALGKFNSWRHERAESKAKVEAPVEKLAPLEGLTPADVAEVLSDIAVPEQDADLEIEKDRSGFIELGIAKGVMTRYGDAYAPDKGLPVGLSTKDLDLGTHLHILGETSSGMTYGGHVAPLTKEEQNPFVENFKACMAGDESIATYERLSEEVPAALKHWSPSETHQVEAGEEPKQETVEPAPEAKSTKAPNLKPYWIAAAVLAVVALGLMTYKLTQRDAPVAPAVEPIRAPASQPVPPAPTPEPVQVAPSPAPAPVAVEVVPAVIEPAPAIPAPVAEPEVQVIKPAKPVVSEKPVARPAPKPVAVAKPPAVEKPKAPKPAPAPAVSPESKKQIDSIRDFEKQLESMGG